MWDEGRTRCGVSSRAGSRQGGIALLHLDFRLPRANGQLDESPSSEVDHFVIDRFVSQGDAGLVGLAPLPLSNLGPGVASIGKRDEQAGHANSILAIRSHLMFESCFLRTISD